MTEEYSQALAQAFPAIEPGVVPLGSRILIQVRTPITKTKSGIILAPESRDIEKWTTTVAKVISLGPLAFHNRTDLKLWPEGRWCSEGSYIRAPRYGGDRWTIPFTTADGGEEEAVFCIINDLEAIALIVGDPLQVKTYIL